MSPRALLRLLVAWLLATALLCGIVHHVLALDVDEVHPRAIVASVWRGGARVARAVLVRAEDPEPTLDAAAAEPGSTRVIEQVVAEGPVPTWPEAALSLSFVPGRDGLVARLGGRTAYVTPDDLLALQAYDRGLAIPSIQLTAGLDLPLVLAKAADDLGVTVPELVAHGTLRRVRVVRGVPGTSRLRAPSPESLSDEDVRDGAVAMARYLARGVDEQGRFRYLVDAPSNQSHPGYDWPRHAGATYFLAQAAALTADGDLRFATLRAAGLLRDHATVHCGEHRCIGDETTVEVGSTALAVLAFVEITRTKLDEGYALALPELTAFLRSQQRADGELMHAYDRVGRRPIDVQFLYFSGEAAFALSRAHALSSDPRDLEAATRLLAYLVGPGWDFFGGRYYRGEEHWTCQAMDDLWDRVPSPSALDFCLSWQAYGRALMYGPGDTLYDADGAYGVGPLLAPHLTPAGSRAEAGVATLEAAMRAGRPPAELEALRQEMRRSLALLLRQQLDAAESSPDAHLFVDRDAVEGAMPGSQVDWQLRIDYDQHAGCALLRWLQIHPNE